MMYMWFTTLWIWGTINDILPMKGDVPNYLEFFYRWISFQLSEDYGQLQIRLCIELNSFPRKYAEKVFPSSNGTLRVQ